MVKLLHTNVLGWGGAAVEEVVLSKLDVNTRKAPVVNRWSDAGGWATVWEVGRL